MSIKKDFGLRLKEIRNKKKITQFQLAEIVGIDAKHMSHIETGRSFPKADLIEKFAAVLGVQYNDFFSVRHKKSKEEIIEEITNLLEQASDEELHKLHKIIFHFLL